MLRGDEFRKTVQLLRFTEFLQENPQYIKGRLSHLEFEEKKEKFNKIAIELNALGPIQRTGEQWYKYFKGLKQHVFGKVYTRKYSIRRPGQVLDKRYHLMEWEKRVVEMLGLEEYLVPNPAPSTQEIPDYDEDFDVNSNSSDTDDDDEDDNLAIEDVDEEGRNDEVKFDPKCFDEEEEEDMINYVNKIKEEDKEDITPEPPLKKFKEAPFNFIKEEIIEEDYCEPNIKLEPKDVFESEVLQLKESDHTPIDNIKQETLEVDNCEPNIKLEPIEISESDHTIIDSRNIKQETIKTEHLEANEENTTEAISSESYFYIKILKDQVSTQKQFYEKMYDDMENIQNSLKSIEEGIKLSAQYKDELLVLKKEKLRMYKEWKIEKKNIADAKLQIKSELVELNERKPKVLEK